MAFFSKLRVKPPKGLLFAGLGLALVCLLLSLWLYLKGFRVAYTEVYKEGPRFYLALTPIWDGYENRVTLIKDIITFKHNGVTLKRSEDGKVCISYFPLPYYRALSIMYGDEYLEKFSHHFVCLGKRRNIDSLLLDEKITFSLEEANTYFLPVSFEGIRICGKNRCLWVYRLDRPQGKKFLTKEQVVEIVKSMQNTQEVVVSEEKAPTVTPPPKQEEPSKPFETISQETKTLQPEPITGIAILYDGLVNTFTKKLQIDQLIDLGVIETVGKEWVYATPFRVCGVPFNYIKGFTDYQSAEYQVLFVQFLEVSECEGMY